MDILNRARAFLGFLRAGETVLPTTVPIPLANVDAPQELGAPIKKDEAYFRVDVNELFLDESRQWMKSYDPMVFVGSEFTYNGDDTVVPFTVGPATVKTNGLPVAQGTVVTNTCVAGPYPYRGGPLGLTVMLYSVARSDHAKSLLKVVESTAGALDFATGLSAYLKVAGAILDGLEGLLGLKETQALAGLVVQTRPNANGLIEPTYYALINEPNINPARLFVKGKKLCSGSSLADCTPFRSADYVLFSINSTKARDDESKLPFYEQWQYVLKEALKAEQEAYKNAKVNLISLLQTMALSPDLTHEHAEALGDFYAAEMKRQHDRAVRLSNLSAAPGDAAMATLRSKTLRLLDE